MKLSMSMIAHYLTGYNPECHIEEDTASIRGVRFLSDQHPVSSRDYVYIGNANVFFQDEHFSDALILANGTNHILCRSTDSENLLNDVLSAFDYYNSLEQELLAASSRHAPLSELLSVVKLLLPDPLLVFGLNGALLGSSRLHDLHEPQILKNISRSGSLGADIISGTFIDKNGTVSHDLTDSPQTLHAPGRTDTWAVSMYLSKDGERLGFVMCFPAQGIRTSLAQILEPAVSAFLREAREFSDASSVFQSVRAIFTDLLEGKSIPESVQESFLTRSGIHFPAVLLVFRSLSIQNYTLRKMLIDELSEEIPSCTGCEHNALVVFAFPEKKISEILQMIKKRFPAENFAAGLSMPFHETCGVSSAYRQAVFALDASQERGIRNCRDLALPFLMEILRKDSISLDLSHPALSILSSYDKEHKAELLPTLCAYLRCSLSQADTARVLHVHLNTLKYRIKRISELSGVDFNNNSDLFYLRISIEMCGF